MEKALLTRIDGNHFYQLQHFLYFFSAISLPSFLYKCENHDFTITNLLVKGEIRKDVFADLIRFYPNIIAIHNLSPPVAGRSVH